VSLIEQARTFAIAAHGDQKRRYTGEPYVTHTQEVAAIVEAAGGDEAMVAAAHLHDVIEDTPATCAEVNAGFGADVADLVMAMTDQVPLSFGNRKVRKRAESERLGGCDGRVQTIKLADIISNTASITQHDPGFARIYLAEMRHLVALLTLGDRRLQERARLAVGSG
jgi:(p)ppGpp synthase/HD superfamily hydrolase